MKCEHIQKLFSPYLDHMTSEEENNMLQDHLRNCPACKEELERLSRMCLFLSELPQPQVPEQFTEDIHRKLEQDQKKIFAPKVIHEPKKASWLVATAAGIALFIGVWVSTMLPWDPMIAKVQKLFPQEEEKTVAVGPILERILAQNNSAQVLQEDQKNTVGQVPAGGNKATQNPSAADKDSAQDKEAGASSTSAVTGPKQAEGYIVSLQTTDLDSASDEVQQIAQNRQASCTELYAGRMMSISSAVGRQEILTIRADQSQAGALLDDLQGMGSVAPVKNTVDYTEEYTALNEQIQESENRIGLLKSISRILTPEEELELKNLDESVQGMKQRQQEIDKYINAVEIQLFLSEPINP